MIRPRRSARAVAALTVVVASFLTFATPRPAQAVSPNVVISEVYTAGGTATPTFANDFVELYNPTNSSVSVAGWSVQYASPTGTSWAVTTLTGTIPPNSYFLVQERPAAVGSPCPSPM